MILICHRSLFFTPFLGPFSPLDAAGREATTYDFHSENDS